MKQEKPEGYQILIRVYARLELSKPSDYPEGVSQAHIVFNKNKYSQEVYDFACSLMFLGLFIQDWSDQMKDW